MTQFYSKNRIVSLFIMLLAATTVMMAAPRTVEQAQQAAMQQMKKHSSKKAQGVSGVVTTPPNLIYSKAKKNAKVDEVAYYVFSYGNDLGYTIVSGDDRLPAIVGYTDNGNYDVENLPINLKSFMQAYQDFAETATDEQIAEIKAWKANATSHPAVAPFMKEKWNQGEPYNNMCPEYQSGKRSVTGCVATAMAQILHYYKCPDNLKATIPAYTTESHGITMSAISVGETYDWANMPNVYTASATQAQKDAVAKLMLNVGCAVKMDYGPSSGAYAPSETFTKYFGMDQDFVRECYRRDYQIAQWDGLLYKEIKDERPVYYTGQSTGGGHAFVIHGYKDGLYYVNWGWGGSCDGYFDITILNPHNNQGAGASSSNDGYSFGNSMIIGIQPDKNGTIDNISGATIKSITQLTLSNTTISGNTLSGTVTYSPQNINLHGTKYVSIGYKENNGEYKNIGKQNIIDSNGENGLKIGYYFTTSMEVSFEFEEGRTYTLCLIESTDNNNWIACAGENTTALNIKVENGEYQIVDYNYALTATAQLNKESGGYASMSNTIDITVNNTGDKEYYNKIYVMINTSEAMPERYTFASGVTAPANGSTTINFSYTPPSEGTYNFWILDANLNEIGKSSFTFKKTEAPDLSFVSIKCTNASGKKVYADYCNSQTEMDKVNDTKAEFTFEINNDGGYYEGIFYFYLYHQCNWPYETSRTLKFPEKATTKFTFTVEGNAGDVVGYALEGNVQIKKLTTTNDHKIQGGEGYYWPLNDSEICYLAGSEYTRDVNTTTGKWNTICLPFNCNIPSDITVEEFAGIEDNKVMFTPVTTMTAGTPYIFKANGNKVEFKDNGEETKDNQNISSACEVTKDNATFVGVWYNTVTFNKDFCESGYTYYGINPDKNQFQQLTETAICTPNHAYLKIKNPANGARALAIVHGDDNTTGISDVNNAEQNQVIYNLNGQRINSPQKGINIINGRKVIIK